jgi:hypothetical protein
VQFPVPVLDQFPDLCEKSVIQVTRPSPMGPTFSASLGQADEKQAYAPMGSSGGTLRGLDIASDRAELREREPKLLTQLTLEIVTEMGAGGRIRSPLGGTSPLRVSSVGRISAAESSVWIFLACQNISVARGSMEHQVAVTFTDTYLDGPGYSVQIFKVSNDLQWTSEVCDRIANFEGQNAEQLDPWPGIEYVEGGSGQVSESLSELASLARAVSVHLEQMAINRII